MELERAATAAGDYIPATNQSTQCSASLSHRISLTNCHSQSMKLDLFHSVLDGWNVWVDGLRQMEFPVSAVSSLGWAWRSPIGVCWGVPPYRYRSVRSGLVVAISSFRCFSDHRIRCWRVVTRFRRHFSACTGGWECQGLSPLPRSPDTPSHTRWEQKQFHSDLSRYDITICFPLLHSRVFL